MLTLCPVVPSLPLQDIAPPLIAVMPRHRTLL